MENTDKKKKKKFVLARHKIAFALIRPIFRIYLKLQYNFSCDKFRGKERDVLILSNHVTTLDPFFVAMSFKFPIYFVASDQIFNLGLASKIIQFLVAPIPKMKGVSDLQTIKDIVAYSKEGGAVSLFPEGNRTFTGKTCNIPHQIGKLIKLVKKPVVIYNIEGGYFSKPRFCAKARRGKTRGVIKEVWQVEEIKDMSAEEIYEKLKKALYVDAYETQEKWQVEYKTSRGAEFLENVLYFCPNCKTFHTFRSEGNFYTCRNCGVVVEYTKKGVLECSDKTIPFKNIYEWFTWQNEYIIQNELYKNHADTPIIFNNSFKMYRSVRGEKRKYLDEGTLSLYSDRLEFDGKEKIVLNLSDVQDLAPQTMGKIQVYLHNGESLVFIGDKRSFSLSFVTLSYMIKNSMEGKSNEFLGF